MAQDEGGSDSGDNTGSITHTAINDDGLSLRGHRLKILGPEIRRVGDSHYMIRLHGVRVWDPHRAKSTTGLEFAELPGEFNSGIPVILGPLSESRLQEGIRAKLFGPQDHIMMSGDRWRTILQTHPEWLTSFGSLGATEGTLTETHQGFPENDHEGTESGVRLDEKTQFIQELDLTRSVRVSPDDAQRLGVFHHTDSTLSSKPTSARPQAHSKSMVSWGAGLVLLVLVGTLARTRWNNVSQDRQPPAKLLSSIPETPNPASAENPVHTISQSDVNIVKPEAWPAELREVAPADPLFEAEMSGIARKLLPIKYRFERGSIDLSVEERTMLKRFSDPASSSLMARKMALNFLAVQAMYQGNAAEAKVRLSEALGLGPSDPVTLLNLALVAYADNRLNEAKETTQTLYRLQMRGYHWVTCVLLGMIESQRGRGDEADRYFLESNVSSPNNPYLLALQFQVKFRASPSSVTPGHWVREILMRDPHKLNDSILPGTFMSHFLMAEAADGLNRLVNQKDFNLSPAQRDYISWLAQKAKVQGGGRGYFGANVSSLEQALAADNSAESRVLYSYWLAKNGDNVKGRQVLREVLNSDWDQALNYSWPWTLLGDIEFELGNVDSAEAAYARAVGLQAEDTAAIHGKALVDRSRGRFIQAQQGLAEVLAKDPLFVPAKLRTSRSSWHRHLAQ